MQGLAAEILLRNLPLELDAVGSVLCHGPLKARRPGQLLETIPSGPRGPLQYAADLVQEYEARIAALERLVGRQALELEFLKGALKSAPRQRSATTSVITGPAVCPSLKDAG